MIESAPVLFTDNIHYEFAHLASLNDAAITKITVIINTVYAETEGAIYKPGRARCYEAGIREIIKDKMMIVALHKSEIVGSVTLLKRKDGFVEFGMLAVDPQFQKRGIARNLVEACENWARENRYSELGLSILEARDFRLPFKDYLKIYYEKMGYKPFETDLFHHYHPEPAEDLCCVCVITRWTKHL